MMREALLHPLRFAGDHRYTRAQASNYLEGELDARSRERVEHHAHACPPCMRLLTSLRRTVSALRTLRDGPSSSLPGVSESVLARLRDEPARDTGRDTGYAGG